MSIDGMKEINLDTLKEGTIITDAVTQAEGKGESLVVLNASLEHFERVVTSLMGLRAANVSAILYIKKPGEMPEDEELNLLFRYLKDWDQLFLHNFLELCGDWVPADFQQALRNEAKIEQKWAKEWLTASADQRIYKYPSLPWRSFIRKIIGENYQFIVKFLELTAAPGTPENLDLMNKHIRAFLETKKKVVCVFPKKWGNKTEH